MIAGYVKPKWIYNLSLARNVISGVHEKIEIKKWHNSKQQLKLEKSSLFIRNVAI